MPNFICPIASYLGLQPAMLTDEPDIKVGFITFRLRPHESYAPTNIAITKSQLIRMRNDINVVLSDPASWHFTPDVRWDQINIPEGFDQRVDPPWANEI